MLAGFISKQVVHSEELDEDAYPIEVADVSSTAGGAEAPSGPEPIADLIAAADIAQGEKLSKACAACHSFDKGGPNKIGPNLWGVYGGPHAHMKDFAYSDAMHAQTGNWDVDHLNAFLWKPKKAVPGTKMNFIGLKKPEDRAAVVKYLQSLK